MEKIGIVVEETVDLSQDIINKHQIAIVPAKLDWPDLEKMPGDNTFQKMRELEKRGIKSFGKTSQPSPNDYIERYRQQLKTFEKVICIPITSKLSGSYNSATLARNFLNPDEKEKVFIIDSLNGSASQGLIVLKAIDLIREGKRAEEIVKELEAFIPEVHLYLMLKDTKFLEASGRISPLVAKLLGRMGKAGIRPLLTFKKGLLKPASIKTGAKDIPTALFKQLEKKTKKLRAEGKKIRITIAHGDDSEGVQRLKEMIEKEFQNTEIASIEIIGNVIGGITGPGTLACAWCEA